MFVNVRGRISPVFAFNNTDHKYEEKNSWIIKWVFYHLKGLVYIEDVKKNYAC